MIDPKDVIISHTLSTLPDSISARRRLLESVASLITSKHTMFDPVTEMIETLDAHEEAQAQLNLGNQTSTTKGN